MRQSPRYALLLLFWIVALVAAQTETCYDSCFRVPLVGEGTAGADSLCGAQGATECTLELELYTTICTTDAENYDVAVTDVDVQVGADSTALSDVAPSVLASRSLVCSDGGVLQLDTAGIYVLWEATGLNCSDLLANLSTRATAEVGAFQMAFLGETWASTTARGPDSVLSTHVCGAEEPVQPDVIEYDDDGATIDWWMKKEARKPVTLTLACSHQIALDKCCSVFGYHNPNDHKVWTRIDQGSNWFIPSPVDRDQRRKFLAETTDLEDFAVIWDCNRHEQHKLTWTIRHPRGDGHVWGASANQTDTDSMWHHHTEAERTWERSVTAVRTRNDCSAEQRENWCLLV